jgi:hypothetical protein
MDLQGAMKAFDYIRDPEERQRLEVFTSLFYGRACSVTHLWLVLGLGEHIVCAEIASVTGSSPVVSNQNCV